MNSAFTTGDLRRLPMEISFFFLAICLLFAAGCRRDMYDQPKSKPLGESKFFPDGASSRPIPPHTVSRGNLKDDDAFFTGMNGTNLVETFPMSVTREVLERGRQRYQINCAMCHGETGKGRGMIVQRGFPAAVPFNDARLLAAPIGHFFDAMTRGYGVMYPQAERVTAEDRWAIAAYIRVLQRSQNARLDDVPSSERSQLEKP